MQQRPVKAAAGDAELPGWCGHDKASGKLLSVQSEVVAGVTWKTSAVF